MTDKEVLEKARKYINKPSKWCQNSHVKVDSKGRTIAYCADAILNRYSTDHNQWNETVELTRKFTNNTVLYYFNDTHSHSEVLDVLDKTIASL